MANGKGRFPLKQEKARPKRINRAFKFIFVDGLLDHQIKTSNFPVLHPHQLVRTHRDSRNIKSVSLTPETQITLHFIEQNCPFDEY